MTFGPWENEDSAEIALFKFMEKANQASSPRLFTLYRQIPGRLMWSHHFQGHKDMRADILIVPSARLLRNGRTPGAIIFEVKRPGERIGNAINQLLDYMNSAWFLPSHGGVKVLPSFGFLFQASKQHGVLASVMAHQHVGTAHMSGHEWLNCHCGESHVLSIGVSGEIRAGNLSFGQGAGSR